MDQIAVQAFTEQTKQAIFDGLGIDRERTTDLGGFESFVFARDDARTILRITHNSHRSVEQIESEIDWIEFLGDHGASVCPAVELAGGMRVRQFHDFVVCEFERARGRTITRDDWSPKLFHSWGRVIGKMHRLTQDYHVRAGIVKRPHWREDENFDFVCRVPATEDDVIALAEQHLVTLRGLPESRSNFGLIHCDAHAGNFHYEPASGELEFFDFDDSCYCWFGYEIATILFSAVLQPWIPDDARVTAARSFMPAFLEGYSKEKEPDALVLDQMALFLKIREISLYGVIRTFLEGVNDNEYANKFMLNRKELIEQDAPYLDIDFTSL